MLRRLPTFGYPKLMTVSVMMFLNLISAGRAPPSKIIEGR